MSLKITRSLLVEDNAIIAMDCEDMLRDLGAETVEACASIEEALAYLSENVIDFALLDLNIGSETSVSVAAQLAKQEIPFLFATGDEDIEDIDTLGLKTIILQKPYTSNGLQEAIEKLTDLH